MGDIALKAQDDRVDQATGQDLKHPVGRLACRRWVPPSVLDECSPRRSWSESAARTLRTSPPEWRSPQTLGMSFPTAAAASASEVALHGV